MITFESQINRNLYMRKVFLLGILISLVSCTRTPERILSKVWGVNVKGLEYSVTSFRDHWIGNGDGETEIRMAVELPQKDIDILISHGAKPLPIVEPENKKRWLERISGINCATDGVYFFEQGEQEQECKFLIYDDDSHVLYYYLSIM